jgi:hypothetical protein
MGWFNGTTGTYVPGWSAVVCLGGVVPAISVATEEKDLVFHIFVGVIVELLDLVVETLPLRHRLVVLELFIRRVGAVDEAEVNGCL